MITNSIVVRSHAHQVIIILFYNLELEFHNLSYRKLHIKERNGCGVNSAAQIVTTTGPVAIRGQTVVKSAKNVVPWFIHTTKDHWTSQILVKTNTLVANMSMFRFSDFQMKSMILAYLTEVTCARSARDWDTIVVQVEGDRQVLPSSQTLNLT